MDTSMTRLAHSMPIRFPRISLIATFKIVMSVRTSVAQWYAATCTNGIFFTRFFAPFALRSTNIGHPSLSSRTTGRRRSLKFRNRRVPSYSSGPKSRQSADHPVTAVHSRRLRSSLQSLPCSTSGRLSNGRSQFHTKRPCAHRVSSAWETVLTPSCHRSLSATGRCGVSPPAI